jgi:hypothetical protein
MTDRIQAIIENHNDVAMRKFQLPARQFADKISSEMSLDGVTFGEEEDNELGEYVMEIIKEYFRGEEV